MRASLRSVHFLEPLHRLDRRPRGAAPRRRQRRRAALHARRRPQLAARRSQRLARPEPRPLRRRAAPASSSATAPSSIPPASSARPTAAAPGSRCRARARPPGWPPTFRTRRPAPRPAPGDDWLAMRQRPARTLRRHGYARRRRAVRELADPRPAARRGRTGRARAAQQRLGGVALGIRRSNLPAECDPRAWNFNAFRRGKTRSGSSAGPARRAAQPRPRRNWEVLGPEQPLPLNGVFFSRRAARLGGRRVRAAILATTDGGKTWQVQRRGGQRAALLLSTPRASGAGRHRRPARRPGRLPGSGGSGVSSPDAASASPARAAEGPRSDRGRAPGRRGRRRDAVAVPVLRSPDEASRPDTRRGWDALHGNQRRRAPAAAPGARPPRLAAGRGRHRPPRVSTGSAPGRRPAGRGGPQRRSGRRPAGVSGAPEQSSAWRRGSVDEALRPLGGRAART